MWRVSGLSTFGRANAQRPSSFYKNLSLISSALPRKCQNSAEEAAPLPHGQGNNKLTRFVAWCGGPRLACVRSDSRLRAAAELNELNPNC